MRIGTACLREGYIHEVKARGVRSAATKAAALHDTAYYTLNRLPDGERIIPEVNAAELCVAVVPASASAPSAKHPTVLPKDWVGEEDQTLVIGPLGLAAWFGLLVTALNLMPIGQLDGGHVTYALLRKRAHSISRIASWICVALVYFGPSWILWAILMRVLGRPHPPTLYDHEPVGTARVLVGVLSLVVFVVCFVPDPIQISWREVLAGTPFERFLP